MLLSPDKSWKKDLWEWPRVELQTFKEKQRATASAPLCCRTDGRREQKNS